MGEGNGRWVSARDLQVGARMRLFCLPHAGSGTAGFHRWKAALRGYGVDVCPVMLPGRETRMGERAIEDAGELIAGLIEASGALVDVPYAIYGHSMGALLAFEWARALARAGLAGPVCLFVGGRKAPQVAYGQGLLRGLGDDEFLAELDRRYGGRGSGLLDDPELREIFLPIVRADLALVEGFRYVPGVALACPVVALAGERDASVTAAGLEAWREVAAGEFECGRLPGDHFFHLGEGQGRLLEIIGRRLAPAR